MSVWDEILTYPAIDQHAHNVRAPEHALPFAAAFTEATDPRVWTRDAVNGLFYRRSLRQLSSFYGCPAQEVESHRAKIDLETLTRSLLGASHLRMLLLDDGLSPQEVRPWHWHDQFVPTRRLLRIEHLADQYLTAGLDFETFDRAYQAGLRETPPEVVGFKCIAAYRGGLDIPTVTREEARAAFRHGRLFRSPFYSYLIHSALEVASDRHLPIQFHTGFGDPDLALETADPLLMRPLFERYSCPFVLLHAGYPFARKSGFLASVYLNVWVDFGLALPFLSVQGMRDCLCQLLELSPLNKILYSSDASLIPELYYLGSLNTRRVLAEVLREVVAHDELSECEALEAARSILAENAARLYRLSG